jgi:hypothetical protein
MYYAIAPAGHGCVVMPLVSTQRCVICCMIRCGRPIAASGAYARPGFRFLKISNNSSIYQLQINGSKSRMKVGSPAAICRTGEIREVCVASAISVVCGLKSL